MQGDISPLGVREHPISMIAPKEPMDATSALALLQGGHAGVQRWNEWRAEVADDDDPSGLDLTSCKLSGLDLREANLVGANLTEVDLAKSDLTAALLDGIDFSAQSPKR